MISATGSVSLKLTAMSAPIRLAIARRSAMPSTAMMRVAPLSFAPAVAHRPIGPCANTATVSPILIAAAFRAAETRAHDVGAHQHLLVGQPVGHGGEVRHGVRHQQVLRLRAVDGVAEAPAAHRLAAALGVVTVQAGMALPARRDRTDDDALPDGVAADARSQSVDHTRPARVRRCGPAPRRTRPSGYARRCRRSSSW